MAHATGGVLSHPPYLHNAILHVYVCVCVLTCFCVPRRVFVGSESGQITVFFLDMHAVRENRWAGHWDGWRDGAGTFVDESWGAGRK